jgi:uncharacterized protein (TIRG00374 family)
VTEKQSHRKKIFNTILGILIAVLLLYLSLRNQNLNEILTNLKSAKWEYIFVALILYFFSYVARSEKWRIQVQNLNYTLIPKTAFYALMLHFFVNSFTVKFGGFIRCANLQRTGKVPFTICFGSYVSECVFDFMFMFLGLFFVLFLHFKEIIKIYNQFLEDIGMKFLSNTTFLIIASIIGLILFVLFVYLYNNKKIFIKHRKKAEEFIYALKMTFNIKGFWIFILWNIGLWVMLYFMNYFLVLSLFDFPKDFTLIFTITAFSYAAWLMPNPGGIGSVEYFILQAFVLFGLSSSSALTFGILSNSFTLFSTLFFGFVVIIIQSLTGIFSQKDGIQFKNINIQ